MFASNSWRSRVLRTVTTTRCSVIAVSIKWEPVGHKDAATLHICCEKSSLKDKFLVKI